MVDDDGRVLMPDQDDRVIWRGRDWTTVVRIGHICLGLLPVFVMVFLSGGLMWALVKLVDWMDNHHAAVDHWGPKVILAGLLVSLASIIAYIWPKKVKP